MTISPSAHLRKALWQTNQNQGNSTCLAYGEKIIKTEPIGYVTVEIWYNISNTQKIINKNMMDLCPLIVTKKENMSV